MSYVKHRLFVCDCNDPVHQLVVSKIHYTDIEDSYMNTDEIYLSVGILEDLNFFKRLWISIRYLFGCETSLVEIILSPEKTKSLVAYLQD